jgi:hypothetical protein
MSDYLEFTRRLDCAEHAAKVELRERRNGDGEAADRAHDRMFDLVADSSFPNITLAELVRRLGRTRSLAIGVDRPIVDLALKRS